MRLNNYVIFGVISTLLLAVGVSFNGPAKPSGPNQLPAAQSHFISLQQSGQPLINLDVEHAGADFSRLVAVSATDGWGLTAEDELYHYTGSTWNLTTGIDNAIIFDIDFASASAGWAVGYQPSIQNLGLDGAIWAYDGAGWRVQSIPGTRQINHIHMISDSAGWAMSANATLRYTAGNWQLLALNATPALTAISSAAAGELWGIGSGGIYFFDGSQWIQHTTSTAVGQEVLLSGIAMNNGTGWAVGDEGTILRYDGANWVSETSNTVNNLHNVTIDPTGGVWAVGDAGTILQRQSNGVWQPQTSGVNRALWTISMTAGNQGWVGGYDSTLLELSGGSWQNRVGQISPASLTSMNLQGVSMLSDTEGWAVGGISYHDDGTFLRYQSGSWQPYGPPAPYVLTDIQLLSGSQGWATGGDYISQTAVIFSFDGVNWSPTNPAGITQTLHALDMRSGSLGWAVGGDDIGGNGVILKYNGANWSAETIPAGTPALYGVSMAADDDGWAVGENGALLRYNGVSWNAVSLNLPGTVTLEAVDMVSATEGWAVGVIYSGATETGLILQYNGVEWLPYSLDGGVVTADLSAQLYDESGLLNSVRLRDVFMLSAAGGVIVGDNDILLIYDGSRWLPFDLGVGVDWQAIAPADAANTQLDQMWWLVGPGGTIYRISFSSDFPYTLFLPIIFRSPTPTPTPSPTPTPTPTEGRLLYFHDFESTHHEWPHYTTDGEVGGDCRSLREGGRYVLLAPTNSRYPCFRFAPSDAEHRYAAFETQGTRFNGSDKVEYGIYINGRGGGEYYLFTIRPDQDCGWKFIRRENGNDDTKRSGGCQVINQGTNILRLEHIRRGNEDVIAFYLNRTYVGEYADRDGLPGTGTGLYMRSRSSDYADVRFDYFEVLGQP